MSDPRDQIFAIVTRERDGKLTDDEMTDALMAVVQRRQDAISQRVMAVAAQLDRAPKCGISDRIALINVGHADVVAALRRLVLGEDEPVVSVAEYRVTCAPPDNTHVDLYTLRVLRHGTTDRWAVVNHAGAWMDAGGQCSWGWLSPCVPAWRDAHLHDLGAALKLAADAARDWEVNGVHVSDLHKDEHQGDVR